MVAWHKQEEANIVNVVAFMLATCGLFYLLARHYLLDSGRLEPSALGCGDCTKACCACAKESCEEKPTGAGQKSEISGKYEEDDDDKFHLDVIWYCTYGSILFFLLLSLCLAVTFSSRAWLGWLPFTYCQNAAKVNGILYVLAKVQMYAVFIARLRVSFQGSAVAYSKRLIYALYISVVINTVAIVVMFATAYRGRHTVKRSANGSKQHFCENIGPDFVYIYPVAYDIIMNLLFVYLFGSALRKLFRHQSHCDEKMRAHVRKENASLRLLPLKCTVLCTSAVLTTFIAVSVFAVTGFRIFFPLDYVCNSAALVLMTAKWERVYSLICTPVIRCVARTPCLPIEFMEADLIEVVVIKKPTMSHVQSLSGKLSGTKKTNT